MKEKIQKAMSALNHVFDDVMRQDGMKHLIIGVVLAVVFKLFLTVTLAFIATMAIMAAKEVVYDKAMGQGTPEPRDMLWGIVGMILGLL